MAYILYIFFILCILFILYVYIYIIPHGFFHIGSERHFERFRDKKKGKIKRRDKLFRVKYSLLPVSKATPIRRTAFRETSFSRRHKGPIYGPLKPLGPSQHRTIVLRCLRGSIIEPPLYRETLVSQTADVIFSVWN